MVYACIVLFSSVTMGYVILKPGLYQCMKQRELDKEQMKEKKGPAHWTTAISILYRVFISVISFVELQ